MPPRKPKNAADPAQQEAEQAKVRAAIRPLNPMGWADLMQKSEKDHWRKLRVTIQIRDKLLAGKPKQLDAAVAMLKARGLEDQIQAIPIEDDVARAEEADKVVDEGLCEFHRREGRSGIWFPTNHVKACLKENWSVLGYRMEIRGSRGAMAEGVFVHSVNDVTADKSELDYIYLGEKPTDVITQVAHTNGPKGPQSSLKRHEWLYRPILTFDIIIAHAVADKLPNEAWARTFLHAQEHGIGACRSQGHGRFDVLSIEDLGAQSASAPAESLKAV
jgi:hypothetical protein